MRLNPVPNKLLKSKSTKNNNKVQARLSSIIETKKEKEKLKKNYVQSTLNVHSIKSTLNLNVQSH